VNSSIRLAHSNLARTASFAALVLATSMAFGQQPPDIVQSDNGENTAMGTGALASMIQEGFTSGNTAVGSSALYFNQTSAENTAVGDFALYANTTGSDNTAVGGGASGFGNGSFNTAIGAGSLEYNKTGYANTASGYQALSGMNGRNNQGYNNTATGAYTLQNDLDGADNTASGAAALYSNLNGSENTTSGLNSLYNNMTGNQNSAFGVGALGDNVAGSHNIALGYAAGSAITGSHNIDIGNNGATGENGAIRIGTSGTHTAVYIAGIESAKITGNAVYVTSSGRLGVLASSERYKTAISSMGHASSKLQRLRPVIFHLKTDPTGEVQYGLIAEEVNKVYPELVIRDEHGVVQGVRYDELAPMLLNEVQQFEGQLAAQQAQLAQQKSELAELKRANELLQAILGKYAKDEQVALR
jgi:hypothetical protein